MPSGVLYLGSTDATVAHWGGPIRRAHVVREILTPNGKPCWIVEVDPPIPAGDGTDLQRVVLADRLSGRSVERLATAGTQEHQLGWTQVYVLRLQNPEFAGDRFQEGDYSIADWAEVALDPDRLPKPLDVDAFWADTYARIRRFVNEHGHSRLPEPYFDPDGKRLDVIVENIRWHHAGKAGVSPGPFTGIDYAAALDELPGWEWWSTLTGSLVALIVAHDSIGSPLREELRPGPPPAQVEATFRGLGLTPPAELIEFFTWHDLEARPGGTGRTDWFWPVGAFRLEEAVEAYRRSVEIGGITPDEIGDELPPDANPATTTYTGFWRTDWFPVFGGGETYAVECLGRGRSPGAVWRVNWHPDSDFQTQRVAPSLAALIDAAVELFRAGAYRWDATYQSVVTVDQVFEERGLVPHYRPVAWP